MTTITDDDDGQTSTTPTELPFNFNDSIKKPIRRKKKAVLLFIICPLAGLAYMRYHNM
ncbi:hypothetical protein QKT49_gp459 [Acanthamoeba castellanii medusavirus]|uniref:Uncharacterized protein n=1 Tax=Acanthamoeba castellanii medusavirus J1 TaxID=3114988 RepID=A0A3T1CWV8_9VIRU|nr:hypothetical protein QKT49_gp459 [Acanthamoeba castellanii medusavirus]BBI30304.1 hypothetical protein [Acanthamoeba castellanii medusavirus J1]